MIGQEVKLHDIQQLILPSAISRDESATAMPENLDK
jgi:hypothetical protein